MAVGSTLITVLTNIPWGAVVDAAPKLAEGAVRFWETTKNFRKYKTEDAESLTSPPQTSETELLKIKIHELEATAEELQQKILNSAQIIKNLAEQNAALVKRVEITHQRLSYFIAIGTSIFLILASAIIYIFLSKNG